MYSVLSRLLLSFFLFSCQAMSENKERLHLLPANKCNSNTIDINDLYDSLVKVGPAQYLVWLIGFLVFAAEFCEVALLSVLIPILRCEWDLSVNFEATITSTIYVTYFLTVPIFGKVADIYGRKPLLITGNLVLAVAGIISATVPNKWLFIICRVIGGVGMGILSGGLSLILEFTPNNDRVTCISLIMIGMNCGRFFVSLLAYYFVSSV